MIKEKVSSLPALPGVYLFKDATDHVIYIGKATSLKHRVRSYFQKNITDWKIAAMVDDIADVDHIITRSETEAALLEAQLIKKHQPKYNILLRDGQPFLYILFINGSPIGVGDDKGKAEDDDSTQSIKDLPRIELVRNKNKKGDYFGPFLYKQPARKAYRYLLNTFALNICNKTIPNGCLDYHLGTCPGTCRPDFKKDDYLFRLELARSAIKEDHTRFTQSIRGKIDEYSKNLEFEKARNLHQYLENIDAIFATLRTHFSEEKYAIDEFIATTPRPYNEETAEHLATELQKLLNAPTPIRTIDCFDISHFQSRAIVGSCVRFTNGTPDKHKFRRFRVRTLTQQDDYAALKEIIARRYKSRDDVPDLIVIDGGKGQLSAAREVLPAEALCVALAKREERLFTPSAPEGILLSPADQVGKTLIALRDYAHHFAVSYHRVRRKSDW